MLQIPTLNWEEYVCGVGLICILDVFVLCAFAFIRVGWVQYVLIKKHDFVLSLGVNMDKTECLHESWSMRNKWGIKWLLLLRGWLMDFCRVHEEKRCFTDLGQENAKDLNKLRSKAIFKLNKQSMIKEDQIFDPLGKNGDINQKNVQKQFNHTFKYIDNFSQSFFV